VVLVQAMSFAVYNPAANADIALHFAQQDAEIVINAVGYVLLGAVSSILPCIRALRGPMAAGLFAG
jgi:hypothetical protein